MSIDKVEVADLDREQLLELNALESKLGVTLVAYEDLSSRNVGNSEKMGSRK